MSATNRLARNWATNEPEHAIARATAALRDDLIAADYTAAAIEELWSRHAQIPHAGAALQRGQRVPALRALAAETHDRALTTLVHAFVLGAPVERAALDDALPRLGTAGAELLGIAQSGSEAGELVRPLVELRAHAFADANGRGDWWIVSDLGELAQRGPLDVEHVLGVGGAAATLSGLLLPRDSNRTLDLGTGSGIQALHASRFSEQVVATDISARALAFGRFTAVLNSVENIEFRLGNLFEPVADERFDRIVSNPPFVITPRRNGVPAYEYRDGGMIGDGLVEAVVRGAAEHLAPGGIAQFLANWEIPTPTTESARGAEFTPERASRDSTAGLARVESWLADSDLDYWVIERERQDPSEYAETWIRDGGTRGGTPEFEALHNAWLDDFTERGVAGVGFGYVMLRAPHVGEAPRLRRTERLHGPLGATPGGLGTHLDVVLAASDRFSALDDDALRAERVAVAGDVTEERHHWPGADAPTVILLRQGSGFARTIDAGAALAALVGASDGSLTLGATSDAIAQLLEVDAASLWSELATMVRDLVNGGILEPQ